MRAVLVTLFTTGLLQLANLGSGMLAARLLLPEGRGELAAAILWPTTLAYLVLLGLNDAVLYHAAKRERLDRLFAAGLWLGIGLSLLAMVAGYVVVLPYAYADYRPEVQALAVLLLFLVPCHILGVIFQEMLRGDMRLGAWNALRLLLGCGYVVLMGVAWALGAATVEGFGHAYLAAHTLPVLVSALLCLRAGWGRWRADRETARRLVAYGARIHTSNVVAMLNSRIDQLLIASALPPAALGLYVVATTLSQVTATLANSVTIVAFPRACAAAPDQRPAVIGLYLRATMVMMVGTTAILYLLAPYALSILFGPAFREATPVVRVLLLGVLPLSIKDFWIVSFKAYDKALAISKGEILTFALNAALLAVMVPAWGLMGAAVAFVAVRWGSAIYLGWLVRRELGIAILPLFRPGADDRRLVERSLSQLRRVIGRA